MKKLFNKLTPNAVLALAVAVCLFFSISALAHNPDTYQAELEAVLEKTINNLNKCGNANVKIVADIKEFQQIIMNTCSKGGMIQAVDGNGNPILFYCSQVIEL